MDERKPEVDVVERDVAVAQVVGGHGGLARERFALRLEPLERLGEEVARRLEAAFVELEAGEQVERGARELFEAELAALGEGRLRVEARPARTRRGPRGRWPRRRRRARR